MAAGRPTPSLASRAGTESCVRQAATSSHVIHARAQNFFYDRESVRLREPFGASHPALHEVGEARQSHQ